MELLNLREYHRPTDESQAVALLQEYGSRALVMGGGTFLHGLVARGLVTQTEYLIDLSRLPISYVRAGAGLLEIGAGTTMRRLEQAPEISRHAHFAGIVDALAYPPPQVRNAATIGGNIAASCPFFDLPVVMLCLGASAVVSGPQGQRRIPLQDLYVSLFQTSLAAGEFVRAVEIPAGAGRVASAYAKLETNANDLALISVGVSLDIDRGRIRSATICLGGGVGEVPVRAPAAEALLAGNHPVAERLAIAAERVVDDIDPISDHRASAAYRRAMAVVLTRRMLQRAVDRLGTSP